MRTLFLLLVLANLAFFAWVHHVSPADSGTDPLPLSRQIEPEKLGILGAGELPRAARAQPAAASAPIACLEWGGFMGNDTGRAQQALEPLALGARLSERKVEEPASWWVFIPPQGDRQGALKKASELKALGESDYFIVQEDGRTRWAISLGIYRSEEAAQARLAALRDKGVRSAQVGARDPPSQRSWFQVRNVDAALQARLRNLAQGFAGSELRECAAPG